MIILYYFKAEQQAALEEKKRKLALEFNHQVLLNSHDDSFKNENVIVEEDVKPFRLFEDIENKSLGLG